MKSAHDALARLRRQERSARQTIYEVTSMDNQAENALDSFMALLKRHLGHRPEVLAEATCLFNEYLFHAFSGVRNESMDRIKRGLDARQTILANITDQEEEIQSHRTWHGMPIQKKAESAKG